MKKALAILGDGYHAVAPLHLTIVKELQNREYDVPFNKFSDFSSKSPHTSMWTYTPSVGHAYSGIR